MQNSISRIAECEKLIDTAINRIYERRETISAPALATYYRIIDQQSAIIRELKNTPR